MRERSPECDIQIGSRQLNQSCALKAISRPNVTIWVADRESVCIVALQSSSDPFSKVNSHCYVSLCLSAIPLSCMVKKPLSPVFL